MKLYYKALREVIRTHIHALEHQGHTLLSLATMPGMENPGTLAMRWWCLECDKAFEILFTVLPEKESE